MKDATDLTRNKAWNMRMRILPNKLLIGFNPTIQSSSVVITLSFSLSLFIIAYIVAKSK